jgi:hypothetical protein
MNVVLKLLLNGVLKYLESHPDEVEKLIEACVQWATAELKKLPKATA